MSPLGQPECVGRRHRDAIDSPNARTIGHAALEIRHGTPSKQAESTVSLPASREIAAKPLAKRTAGGV